MGPWPWPPLRLTSQLHLAPTPMLKLTPGMVTMGMEDTGEDTEVTTDPMDTMVTTERDLLMKLPLPSLAPTPTLRLTPGMGTMGMEDTGEDTEVTMDPMVTMERGLLMKLPLPLAPMLMPKLTPGMGTMGMLTGLTVMDTMGTGLMVMLTGDKKWTSTTSNNIRSFPADSSLKRQFLQNNFLFPLLKNSFVLCIRVPGTV